MGIAVFRNSGAFVASVLPGFFKNHSNTHSFLDCNLASGAIAASSDDEHKIMVLSPIFELLDDVVKPMADFDGSMSVHLRRMDGGEATVSIAQQATVQDLKDAVCLEMSFGVLDF